MPVIELREALRAAMTEEMERDENVFLMGEEVAQYQGAYKVSKGMLEKFGPERVLDTPISEAAFTGLGVGAAMVGMRPIVEYMSWSFTLVCLDQIVNNAANVRYMSGGQVKVPIVLRGGNGIAHQLGATHSHRVETIYARIPGLIVVCPSTAYEAKGLLKSAIRCDDPVIFLESEKMLADKDEVPDEEYTIPIGVAKIEREGKDVTILSYGRTLAPRGSPGRQSLGRCRLRSGSDRLADASSARRRHHRRQHQEDAPLRDRRRRLRLLRHGRRHHRQAAQTLLR